MARVIDVINLPDGNTKRIYDSGLEQIVDSQTGKIISTVLPKKLASQMAKRKAEKQADVTNDVDALLDELGLESMSARLLAEQFVSGGAGAVGAARELFKMSKPVGDAVTFESAGHYYKIPPGDRCPRCGTWNIDGMYTNDELKTIIDDLHLLGEQIA